MTTVVHDPRWPIRGGQLPRAYGIPRAPGNGAGRDNGQLSGYLQEVVWARASVLPIRSAGTVVGQDTESIPKPEDWRLWRKRLRRLHGPVTNTHWRQPANSGSPSRQDYSYPGTLPPFVGPSSMNRPSAGRHYLQTGRPGTTQTWTLDVEQQLPGIRCGHGLCWRSWRSPASLLHDPNQGFPVNQCGGAFERRYHGMPAMRVHGQTRRYRAYADQRHGFSGSEAVPQYGNSRMWILSPWAIPPASTTYHALQVTAKKSISAGLTLLASYAWQKDPYQFRL